MKKLLSIALLVAMLVGCTNAPAENATPEATGESSEMARPNETPEALKTETELGIAHPLHFADDYKIVPEESRLVRKSYEVPAKMDEDHPIRYGVPLAKGLIEAKIETIHEPNGGGPMDHLVTAVGYYDLEEKRFVPVADDTSEHFPLEPDSLFPVDGEHMLYEDYSKDGVRYFLYTIADGSMKEILANPHPDGNVFAYVPYTTATKLYLPEYQSDYTARMHVFDAKTGEELETLEDTPQVRPWKDGLIRGRVWEEEPTKFSDEWIVGDKTYHWLASEGKFLLELEVGADGIYATSVDERSDDLAEDLTEEDKAMTRDHGIPIPLFMLKEIESDKVLARTRRGWLNLSVSGPWVALWKTSEDVEPLYLLLPEKKEVVRIARAPGEFGLSLLSYERWGLLSFISDIESESYTVHTIEEKK